MASKKYGSIPTVGATAADYTRFTRREWERLDGFYSLWVERWRRVMDFLRSQHWRALQEYNIKQLPDWKRYPVVDMTLAAYIDFLSQFLSSEVRYSAIPASPDDSDIQAAMLAENLLRYHWDMLNMEENRLDLGAWLVSTGNANLRTYWDTNTGNLLPLAIPVDGGRLVPVSPDGSPLPEGTEPIMLDAGEVNVEVVSPNLVRWQIGGNKRIKSVMVGALLTYDEAFDRFGEKVAESLSYTTEWAGLKLDMLDVHEPSVHTPKEDRALVVEHYFPKSYRYPRGLWWICSDRELIIDPADLPAGVVPLVPFRWAPLPGHPTLGMSPLYSLTKTNKLYDQLLAYELELLDKMIPKLLYKSGGGLKPGDFDDKPAQELVVHAGAEPEWLLPPEMPKTAQDARNEVKDAHHLVGGWKYQKQQQQPMSTAISRFRQPQEMLNFGGNTQLAIQNSGPAWVNQAKVQLAYVSKFYVEDRVIQVVGPDRSYQWVEFSGKDLENLEATIRVDDIPLNPFKKMEIRDSVVAFLQTETGRMLFMDEQGQVDMGRLRKAVQAVGIDEAIEALDEDVLEARNEHALFRNVGSQALGQVEQIPIQPWNNHAVHLAEHSILIKGAEFRAWPQEKQKVMLDHMGQHEQMLNQAQQAQEQAMMQRESQLREIRGEIEQRYDTKTAFAEEIATLVADIIRDQVGVGKDKK